MGNIFQIEENVLNYLKNRQPQKGNWKKACRKATALTHSAPALQPHPVCTLGFFMQALHYAIRGVIFRSALGRGQLKALCASGEQAGGDSVPSSTDDVTHSTQT